MFAENLRIAKTCYFVQYIFRKSRFLGASREHTSRRELRGFLESLRALLASILHAFWQFWCVHIEGTISNARRFSHASCFLHLHLGPKAGSVVFLVCVLLSTRGLASKLGLHRTIELGVRYTARDPRPGRREFALLPHPCACLFQQAPPPSAPPYGSVAWMVTYRPVVHRGTTGLALSEPSPPRGWLGVVES